MRTIKIKQLNRVGIWSILFLFLFFFNVNAITVYKDSSKTKTSTKLSSGYDINDPRNPHCPCHKYQKLADDEYRKLKEKEMRQYGFLVKKEPNKTSEFPGKSFSNEETISKKHSSAFIKLWRKKKKMFYKQLHRGHGISDWDIWKRLNDPTACYHWK